MFIFCDLLRMFFCNKEIKMNTNTNTVNGILSLDLNALIAQAVQSAVANAIQSAVANAIQSAAPSPTPTPEPTPPSPTEKTEKTVSDRKVAQWAFTKKNAKWLQAIWVTGDPVLCLDYLEKIPLTEKAFQTLLKEYPNHDLQVVLPVLPSSILIDLARKVVIDDVRFCGQRWGSNPRGAFSQAAAAEAKAQGKTVFKNAYGFEVPVNKMTVRQKIAAMMAAKGAKTN